MTPRYYFDHAASAPRREEVAAAMEPWLHGVVGNPSGAHRASREARRAVEDARDEVAAFVGAAPGGVIFTAGGTESCHLAVAGVVRHHRRHHATTSVVVSRVEHHAVLDAARAIARDFDDVRLSYVDVDADGVVDLAALGEVLTPDVALVSVMTANNETGVLQPLDGVRATLDAALAGSSVLHTDAVAGAPWLTLSDVTAPADLVSLCAHKLGGPVNAGALVVRRETGVDPVVPGGGQERGRRGGTVDVAAAVGLAAAVRATARELREVSERVGGYQRRLTDALARIPGCWITAPTARRVAGVVHVTFDDVEGEELLYLLDERGVCASAAASCSSGASESSHVLEAMGLDPDRCRRSLRLSMGTQTTSEDVDAAIAIVSSAVTHLRGLR